MGAAKAKQGRGRGALFCSRSEGGRGKDSPPALPERRMQMSAMQGAGAPGCAG